VASFASASVLGPVLGGLLSGETGLVMGMFLAALDQTIVSTAIKTIGNDLHDLQAQAWVVPDRHRDPGHLDRAVITAHAGRAPAWRSLGMKYGSRSA
jgi:hypothetical protein